MQATRSLIHPALFYRSEREYLDGLVPFVVDGLTEGCPVLVAVPGDRLVTLRTALGDAARDVTMVDMAEAGRNPGRIIGGVLGAFADRHPGRSVRIIGEPIWPGRTETEYPACAQHEALINLALGHRDMTVLCPYDVAGLDADMVADARATHPVVWQAEARTDSPEYAPEAVVGRYNRPLAPGPDAVVHRVESPAGLVSARRFAGEHGRRLGLTAERADDLQLIVTELVSNSLEHAAGACDVALWRQDDRVGCEVRDTGHLTDPLAGRLPPAPGLPNGRGLLLVNELSDLLRIHTTPQGTTVHAYLRLGPS